MPAGKKPRRPPLRSRVAAIFPAGMAASLVLGKLSCPASGPAPAPPSGTPTVAIPPAQPEIEVPERLRKDAVLSTSPARRTLFTWTTRDQIEALVRDKVLLTRIESPVHGPAFFDQVVAKRAAAGDALAQKLRTETFGRSRFAWANPWATLLGWPGEGYGEELIAVHLKPEAWTLKLSTGKPGWEAFDADNRPVDPAEVLLHPERIGAVYFVHDTPAQGYARSTAGPAERAAFREYVLCNEAMIERWEIGTPAITDALGGSAELAERLAANLTGRPPSKLPSDTWNAEVARTVWPGPALRADVDSAYEAALAFPNEHYLLLEDRMGTLARRLRGVTVRGPSLSHVPTVTAAAVASASASARALPPPVPRKPKVRRGTWGTF